MEDMNAESIPTKITATGLGMYMSFRLDGLIIPEWSIAWERESGEVLIRASFGHSGSTIILRDIDMRELLGMSPDPDDRNVWYSEGAACAVPDWVAVADRLPALRIRRGMPDLLAEVRRDLGIKP